MPAYALISVIVPIYNCEKYIRKCVDSILVQTYTNLEIILVDDGSTDAGGNICDAYAKQDARIKVIHQSNAGLSVARNAGVKNAQGEYISFVDADDWVEPIFIETLWKTATKYQTLISGVSRYVAYGDRIQPEYMSFAARTEKLISVDAEHFNSEQTLEMLFVDFDRYVTSKLFHVSLFQYTLFPEGFTFEDIWILYRLFQHINAIAINNVPLYWYNRQNENSLSRGKFRISMLDYFKITDEFIAEARTFKKSYVLRSLQRDRLAHICGFFKRMMLSNFNDPDVIKPLQQELRHNLWILLLHPRPLHVTAFGVACAVSFKLTKKMLIKVYHREN